ncbi:(3S,6E)-nerolidol synthase 1, partial [Trifolium pratense]
WILYLNSVLKEAQWLNSGYLPKADEYLNNGIVSPGVHLVLIHAFFLFDHSQDITKETIAILDDDFPNIMYSVAKILRLSDDLEGDKSGDQNGLDGSYLDCYMNEHQYISAEEAQRHVANMISNEWKRLNQEIIIPNPIFSSSFTKFCLDVARMVPLMYHYKSNPSLTNLQELVKSLVNVNASGDAKLYSWWLGA